LEPLVVLVLTSSDRMQKKYWFRGCEGRVCELKMVSL